MTHPWATVGAGNGGAYAWFHPEVSIEHEWGNNLPHWRQPGAIYFTTFRAADSMPAERVAQWKKEREEWLASHPDPRDADATSEYHQLFTERWHRWLDESLGACVFKNKTVRDLLESCLRYLDGEPEGHALDAFVIMPNHVHVLVSPTGNQTLSAILKAWKRVSAHRINRALGIRGAFWQEESWDHLVRGPASLEKFRAYIGDNPKSLQRIDRAAASSDENRD